MGRSFWNYRSGANVPFSSPSGASKAAAAIRRGSPLKAKMHYGRFEGSIVSIDAKYISISPNNQISIHTGTFVAELADGRKIRFNSDSSVAYNLKGRQRDDALVLKEHIPPPKPEHFEDRHGNQLGKGDLVLISVKQDFVFGHVDNITHQYILVKRGKARTRVENTKTGRRCIVKLDKSIADRFLMEKLAKL